MCVPLTFACGPTTHLIAVKTPPPLLPPLPLPRHNQAPGDTPTTTTTTAPCPQKGLPASSPAPAPALGTRRSSDLTVGIADSPQMLPEGLKTDEEDYGGRRGCGSGGEGCIGIDFAPPAAATVAMAMAAAACGGQPKLAGTVAGDREEDADQPPSTCESVGGDASTHVGSFRLPDTRSPARGPAGTHPEDGAGAGVGGRASGGGGGGDDVDELEMGSEAGLTVVTASETPAAATSAPATSTGGGSSGRAAGGTAAAEQAGGGSGGGGGGCMLDAFREPEGNDWGELEDWHGLPGLQLAGGGGGGAAAARLQVTTNVL